jgi:hypothetical protein
MVKPQCFMVQAMQSWPVGTKFLRGHDHEPQATAHLEKGWKPGGGPKFPDHQPLGELMSMALQSNPQWDAENGVCEATSSGTSPSPTTKHYVDLRVHPHLRGYKRRKLLQAPVPMLIGVVHIPIKGTKKTKKVKALVDSGASHCFLVTSIAKHFKRSSSLRQHAFATVAGPVKPKARTQVKFKLPELSSSAKFQAHFYVSDELCGYDMILGRDFLREIKLDILFSEDVLRWNDMDIRMKPSEECAKEAGAIAYSERFASKYGRRYEYEGEDDPLEGEILRLKDLADARYKPPDIDDYVETMEHLDDDEKLKVKALLVKHMSVLDGKLGTWVGKPISLPLKPDVKPYCAKQPYPIPQSREAEAKATVAQLVEAGILVRSNESEWGSPCFFLPKKDSGLRFICDLREINKRLVRKPYPLPKVQDLLRKIGKFKYATTLDLVMGFYNITMDEEAQRICTLILPWGKYRLTRLAMGLVIAPDVFQARIHDIFHDLEKVFSYIDDLALIDGGSFDDHYKLVDEVLTRLGKAGLKCKMSKCKFFAKEFDYLGHVITQEGITPCQKKIEAILKIEVPRTVKQLRRFIGMVNYYRDMYPKRSELIRGLTKIAGSKKKFTWGPEQQQSFEAVKRVIAQDTMLRFPDFTKPFEIHTDASHTQLGGVISQEGKPLAFFSRTLNSAQTRYTTTERELLSIVETLKEYRNILLGHEIIVYTDHKNLTFKQYNTERVLRWRMIAEEYGPEIRYIQGEHNVVADALSRLEKLPNDVTPDGISVPPGGPTPEAEAATECLATCYASKLIVDGKLPDGCYPLRFARIQHHQLKDRSLRENTLYSLQAFHGGKNSKFQLYADKMGKIAIPKSLQKQCWQWYHDYLVHPGFDRTYQSIADAYTWVGMHGMIKEWCRSCDRCQRCKTTYRQYGLLPPKQAEEIPWERLCVDCIGPYTFRRYAEGVSKKDREKVVLRCVTMIDPATGWFEIAEVPDFKAFPVTKAVEKTWLTRYPWPSIVQFDRGSEFKEAFNDLVETYQLIPRPSTARNPQANSILERIHRNIGDYIRLNQMNELELPDEDPFYGLLNAVALAVRATWHSTLQASPMQLVFQCHAFQPISYKPDWELIRARKQAKINKNNQRENSSRIPHEYSVGDKVLVEQVVKTKFSRDKYMGPFQVLEIPGNGTLKLALDGYEDTINLRRIKPYVEPSDQATAQAEEPVEEPPLRCSKRKRTPVLT